MLRDVRLWCYALLWSGFVVGIRGTQTWMAVYATNIFRSQNTIPLNEAVAEGGLLALAAYSLVGRGVGCPLAGRLSDVLARRGVSRTAVLIAWLLVAIAMLLTLSAGISTIWSLVILAALLGMSVNLFSLIPAAIAENTDRSGPRRCRRSPTRWPSSRAQPYWPSAGKSASRSTRHPATPCRTTAASG